MDIKEAINTFHRLKTQNPLVHNITNVVVTNFTANGLLALGASPVMAYAREEVADMAKVAGSLVLNIGTLTAKEVEAMTLAGKSANEHGVPVIFDPVGAGATPYRAKVAKELVEAIDFSIIRGNAAEITNLVGDKADIKGVDAGDTKGDVVELATRAARQLNAVVAITGETDVITDGKTIYTVHNGHAMLTKITGAGCLLSSITGAFAAVEKNFLKAATAALTIYGIAAQIAAEKTADLGPGSFQVELLNQLYLIQETDITERHHFEKMNWGD